MSAVAPAFGRTPSRSCSNIHEPYAFHAFGSCQPNGLSRLPGRTPAARRDAGQREAAVEVGRRSHERVGRPGRVRSRGLVAARERLHERAHVVAAAGERVLARDEDQLVVRRHADLLHADDRRSAARASELHALDVPERAERRVDSLRQHRRHEVEADVRLLHRVHGHAGALEDRLQVGALVGDAGRPDAAASEVARTRRSLSSATSARSAEPARPRRLRRAGRPCRARSAAPARRRSRGRPCRPRRA